MFNLGGNSTRGGPRRRDFSTFWAGGFYKGWVTLIQGIEICKKVGVRGRHVLLDIGYQIPLVFSRRGSGGNKRFKGRKIGFLFQGGKN